LIVRLGVLVGGVVGAGHPAAGQAEPQRHPAASTIKALQALGRVWLDRAGAGEVIARAGAVEVPPGSGCSWHRSSQLGCRRGEVILKVNSPGAERGNGQAAFSSSCGLMSDTERIPKDGTSGLSGIWLGDWLQLL
jgi:hypothetical protein